VVAENGFGIIGFVHYSENNEHAVIKGLGVLERFRKQGIGNMLLESAVAKLGKKSKNVYLKVKVFNPAVNIYGRNGFFLKNFGTVMTLVKKPDN
jgi:ribosomal protein S18 acetylase RimI-like enzyme